MCLTRPTLLQQPLQLQLSTLGTMVAVRSSSGVAWPLGCKRGRTLGSAEETLEVSLCHSEVVGSQRLHCGMVLMATIDITSSLHRASSFLEVTSL